MFKKADKLLGDYDHYAVQLDYYEQHFLKICYDNEKNEDFYEAQEICNFITGGIEKAIQETKEIPAETDLNEDSTMKGDADRGGEDGNDDEDDDTSSAKR